MQQLADEASSSHRMRQNKTAAGLRSLWCLLILAFYATRTASAVRGIAICFLALSWGLKLLGYFDACPRYW